jgi:hypothetical protein
MDHAPPHGSATLIILLAIPLIIWLRLRRIRRSSQAQDFWFEPEGDHFIYHPFGRFGGAFLVSAETRTAIRARRAQFTRIAGIVLLVAILGPLCLLSLDETLYWQYRPWFLAVRVGMILALLAGGLIWRVVAVRPLYAGAAAAPRRIAMGDVRARQAAARSWWGVGIGFAVTGALAAFFLFRAVAGGQTQMAIYGGVLGLLALLNARVLIAKLRLRGG